MCQYVHRNDSLCDKELNPIVETKYCHRHIGHIMAYFKILKSYAIYRHVDDDYLFEEGLNEIECKYSDEIKYEFQRFINYVEKQLKK